MLQYNPIGSSLPVEFGEFYQFDPANGYWVPKNGIKEFAYSDGNEVELRIYDTIRSTDDLSSISVELAKRVTDWPSKYHLSSLRGNLLRPFQKLLQGKILEIGAGCGAITRFLGECGGDVVALEGSHVRAAIAAARCKGLKNVKVIVDAAHRLPPSPTYDIVTLVGVLEYARKYFPNKKNDGVIALIRHARAFLKPKGLLIVAIENQLGLKYFAGCDEDHVGTPMFGIEDRYHAEGVVTFGRRELGELLYMAGLPAQSWWYPFPDYKLPTVVASENALSRSISTKLQSVVAGAFEMDPQLPTPPLFSLERAWGPVIRNGLGPDLSNSFLVLAGMKKNESILDGIGDVYYFAVQRKPEYAKKVVFKIHQNDKISIHQELLYPDVSTSGSSPIKITVEHSQKFVEGQLWSQRLRSILSTNGWCLTDLISWANRWYIEFIKESQLNLSNEILNASTLVAKNLIDAVPRNLIFKENGEGVFIDKEWSVDFPLELGYIVFRGVFLALLDIKTCTAPNESLPAERSDLFKIIAKSFGLIITDSDLKRYLEIENRFQEGVSGRGIDDQTGVLSSKLEIISNKNKVHCIENKNFSKIEKDNQNKVSIIIPVYNKIEFTKRCIESISNTTKKFSCEILVINNGSTDGTYEYLKSIQSRVKIINNEINLGFSKACNQGIREANAPYLLFLNNDTEPQPNWLEPLVEVLDSDSSVAAVGSKLLFPDRTIQHAGVAIALHQQTGNICPFHLFYKEKSDLTIANMMMEYSVCTAACLLSRADRLRWLGGFDESFWNGYEDVDLCLRFCQNGWRVVYQPKSVLIHYESQSGPERFSKEKQNVELLQRKWHKNAPIDFIIHPDGQISQQKGSRIKIYFDSNAQGNFSEGHQQKNNERQALAFIPGLTSIIIPTFNQLKYTKECLESIQKNTTEPYEIIFVDNGSSDGTSTWLHALLKKNSNLRVVQNTKNYGFAIGCNQGIEVSKGEYILILNNDVVVSPKWLGKMLECLNSAQDIGIIGPMTNCISGIQQIPSVDYFDTNALYQFAKNFSDRNRYRKINSRRIVGFCMLFRKRLVHEIGYLDESFGSGNFEDDDFCLRATLAGYQNMIAGDVFIHHYGSRTFIGNRIDYSASISGNRKLFDAKWSSKEVVQQYGKKLIIQNALNLAEESSRKGDIEQATAHMLTAIKEAPREGNLYRKLAEILIDAKRYSEAMEILESIPQNGNDATPHALMGYCQEALGCDEKALEHVELALAIDPQMPLALNVRGVLACKRGELEAAEGYFKSAIEAAPSFGESYTNLGSMKWAAGEHEAALDLFERGFILTPTAGDVASAYHTAVVETQSLSRAETVLAEACALHPNDRRIAFIRIAVLIQQEKNEEAMDAIENAMLVFGIDDGMLSAAQEVRSRIGPVSIRKGDIRKKLSVCMIVKNEEAHLARCLQSIKPVADEIIVVDTGSTDRTKAIASAMGAHVYDFQWTNDFSEARNFSLSKASGGWILVLDADEVISPLDHLKLKKIIKNAGKKRQAYTMVTRNYTDQAGARDWSPNEGSYIREEAGKGWIPSPKVRLFPNDRRVHFVNPVHELVEPSLKTTGIQVKDCDVPVHHYGRLNQEKLMAKGEAYYQLGVEKIEKNTGDYNALRELAIQAAEIGRYAEAVDIWQRAIALKPEDASAYMNLGYAHLMLNQYDKVAEYSRKALQLDPDLREAALNHAAAELIAGDAKRAVAILEGILTKHPNYPPAMGRLVAAHVISGQKEAGLAYLDRLVQLGFDCAVMLEEQARALHVQGKTEQAAILLETAIANGIANERMHAKVAEWRRRPTGHEAVQGMTNTINQTAAQPSVHRNVKATPQPSV